MFNPICNYVRLIIFTPGFLIIARDRQIEQMSAVTERQGLQQVHQDGHAHNHEPVAEEVPAHYINIPNMDDLRMLPDYLKVQAMTALDQIKLERTVATISQTHTGPLSAPGEIDLAWFFCPRN